MGKPLAIHPACEAVPKGPKMRMENSSIQKGYPKSVPVTFERMVNPLFGQLPFLFINQFAEGVSVCGDGAYAATHQLPGKQKRQTRVPAAPVRRVCLPRVGARLSRTPKCPCRI